MWAGGCELKGLPADEMQVSACCHKKRDDRAFPLDRLGYFAVVARLKYFSADIHTDEKIPAALSLILSLATPCFRFSRKSV